ncbi:MAG: class I SAM-dependent methyltransferase [Proteobacteria bacterium]|nr:class I SAM-dependent methyltransferase [Pseudomonadota bacterium]
MTAFEFIAGSFRDRRGRVIRCGDRIFRAMSGEGAKDFARVERTGLLSELIDDGLLVPWWSVPASEVPLAAPPFERVLEHERLAFVSYPYEWSFGALKAAALTHLDIQIRALEKDVGLVDASAFNVQFHKGKPIFIDHLSFRPYQEGEYWLGHRQFCEEFLNPLVLRSVVGIPHNDWYRGALQGPTNAVLVRLLPFRAWFNWMILTNVILPERFEKRALAAKSHSRVSEGMKRRKFPKSSYKLMLGTLRRGIERLEAPSDTTAWDSYAGDNIYGTEEAERKRAFVARFSAAVRPNMVWDIGCNTGEYAKVALENGAGSAIGFETDALALEKAYRRAVDENLDFTPLYMDATNPSPSQGWHQTERDGLEQRRGADAVFSLAILHHICIGRNVPLNDAVAWLVEHAPRGIIEFVPKEDPMVRELLALRDDIFSDYSEQVFAAALSTRARVVESETITASGRRLFWFERT